MWFALAEDVNLALMKAAIFGTENAKSGSMSREAIGTRVGLRSAGTLQGAILLTERGMVAESRMLARSLIEDAFAMAALHDKPDEYIQRIREDSNESRRNQARFIEAERLLNDNAASLRLKATIEAMDKGALLSPKAVAKMGPLTAQYLAYQRLSDDAAHTSARSLDRHVNANATRTAWNYRWEPGTAEENAATLHSVVLAALPIGIGLTQILEDRASGALFGSLVERFQAMPSVSMI